MTNPLQDKVTLITGASSGFGADSARLFARKGCTVILTARRMERLNALAEEIRAEGGQALAIPLDVREQTQIEAAVKEVLERYGRIDILFNNAGLSTLNWLECQDPVEDIDCQINVNLRGLIQVTRAALPSMLARRQGTIINMSSVAGLIAPPSYTIYSVTKFGIRAFTDALRREVSPFGIHVSGIYPGPAITEINKHPERDVVSRHFKTPRWMYMSSEYVARRVVGLAIHPRRRLVIPWYFHLAVGLENVLPGVVDWLVTAFFTNRYHRLESEEIISR